MEKKNNLNINKDFQSLFKLLMTTKKTYSTAISKHKEYYLHHLETLLTLVIKKYNSIYYYKNLTSSNQAKYKTKPHDFWIFDNPIDYNKKLHRNNNFYNNYVLKYDLQYSGVHKILELLREFNICNIKKGQKYSTTPTATIIELKDPKYWMIPDNTSQQEYDRIILPALKYHNNKERGNVIIRNKTLRADGTILPLKPRSKKPIDCKNIWTKRGSSGKVSTLNYINEGIPNEEYHYNRIFKNDEKTGGRFYSPLTQMSRKTRQEYIKRFDLIELDYKCNNINIIYQIVTGSKYPGDPYNDTISTLSNKYPGLNDKVYRKVIKTPHLTSLGADSRESLHGSIISSFQKIGLMYNNYGLYSASKLWQDFLDDNYFDPATPKIFIKPNDIIDAIEETFIKIKPYLYGYHNDKLQFIESEMQKELFINIRKDNIPPLGVHDSIIVPIKMEEKYKILKEKIFIKFCEKYKDLIIIYKRGYSIKIILHKIKRYIKNILNIIDKKLNYKILILYSRLSFLHFCDKIYYFT